MELRFKGMCLSSVQGKKTSYTEFVEKGEPGKGSTLFKVSCNDQVALEDQGEMVEWTLTGVVPVSGVRDGQAFAYFKAATITGKKSK